MPTHSQPTNPERIARLLTMVSILIVVWVLFVAREVLVPLALAMLFSFLLAPVVTRLERWRFGRIPAVLATVFLAFCVVAGVGYLVFGQLYDLTIQLPKYKNNISAKIASLKSTGKSPFSEATDTIKELGKQLENTAPEANGARPVLSRLREQGTGRAGSGGRARDKFDHSGTECIWPGAGSRWHGGDCRGVRDVHAHQARRTCASRIIHLIGRGQLNTTTQALDEAAHKVSGYLFMQLIINVCFGIPIGIGLYFIGVPNAFLWGLLATLLRFVPYLGAWIALGVPPGFIARGCRPRGGCRSKRWVCLR